MLNYAFEGTYHKTHIRITSNRSYPIGVQELKYVYRSGWSMRRQFPYYLKLNLPTHTRARPISEL